MSEVRRARSRDLPSFLTPQWIPPTLKPLGYSPEVGTYLALLGGTVVGPVAYQRMGVMKKVGEGLVKRVLVARAARREGILTESRWEVLTGDLECN